MKAPLQAVAILAGFVAVPGLAHSSTKPWLFTPGHAVPVEVGVGGGYGTRSADMRWNIAGSSDGPNILSELRYEGLRFTEFRYFGHVNINEGPLRHWRFETGYSSGEAESGSVYDSDYEADNRQQEYSRSQSDATGSETTHFTTSAGYRLEMSPAFSLTPMAGYAYSTQYMQMTNGVQKISTRVGGVSLGNFLRELNSHYSTEWRGPWLGLGTAFEGEKQSIKLRYTLHLADYYADANWNLREDFAHPKSFEHNATGTGQTLELRYQWRWAERWALNARAFREDWSTETGSDTVFLADGTRTSTRLNEVAWESSGYDLGLEFVF